MKRKFKQKDIYLPVPAALIVCGENGNYNIITLAWTGIVSSKPPAIEISLHKDRYSLELIQKTGEFTVNVPPAELYVETDYCGVVSGRKRNKFVDTRLTPEKSAVIKTPIIKECPFNLECIAFREIVLGDFVMVIGEIVEVHIDEDKFMENNKNKVDVKKLNPLVYCSTIREYWSIGEKLGDAFSCGLKFKVKQK